MGITRTNKGVHRKKSSGNYEAYVMVKSAGKRSNKTFKAHIGTYKTEREARIARETFIKSLI